jgi:hypothetical protein
VLDLAKPGLEPPRVSWAWTAAVACLRREAVEMERCNIISDILLFFKIGFFVKLTNDSLFESV